MSIKICSKCKIAFECCNEKPGCWCEELAIELATLNELKKQFENCLCPVCLQEFANKRII